MHNLVSSYPNEEKRDTFMYRTEHSILPDKTESWSQNLHRSFFRPAKAGESSPKILRSKSIVRNDKSILFFLH